MSADSSAIASLARTDRYLHNASVFVRDVLKHFDLPQVAATVADRRLTMISPVDAMKQRVDEAAASSVYKETLAAYRGSRRGRPVHDSVMLSKKGSRQRAVFRVQETHLDCARSPLSFSGVRRSL